MKFIMEVGDGYNSAINLMRHLVGWVFTEMPFPRTGISPNTLRVGIHQMPLYGALSPNISNNISNNVSNISNVSNPRHRRRPLCVCVCVCVCERLPADG